MIKVHFEQYSEHEENFHIVDRIITAHDAARLLIKELAPDTRIHKLTRIGIQIITPDIECSHANPLFHFPQCRSLSFEPSGIFRNDDGMRELIEVIWAFAQGHGNSELAAMAATALN